MELFTQPSEPTSIVRYSNREAYDHLAETLRIFAVMDREKSLISVSDYQSLVEITNRLQNKIAKLDRPFAV